VWLKLVRAGTKITAYSSADGNTWATIGTATVTMATNVYVGLAVCSHNTGALNTATFDNLAIGAATTTATSTPVAYADGDIGSVGLAGSASFGNGTYTVKGAGADIWGTADSFNFASVNGATSQVVVRVASVQNTNSVAKAGIMIRESLAAGSMHVLLDVKPGGGIEFMARTATGGSTTYVAGNSTQAAPVWLKLVRSGSTFTGYTSNDGATWSAVGNVTVNMASTTYAGLVVCSHNTSALNTSTFTGWAIQ
jgi:regulation of enolase protein 1 (concanavalin A-like superfamily)